MSHLKRLEAMLLDERASQHRRRCKVCRNGQKVLAALAEFRRARVKDPEKWSGVTWATLLRWTEARKAGIDLHSLKRHFMATDPAFYAEVAGG